MKLILRSLSILILLSLISGCAQPTRLGMIKDPETGLQYGSVIEKSFFVDSSQFENKGVKITARNVSGDVNYDINNFIRSLEGALISKGYEINDNDNFGIKYDVIIEYSGHIQNNLAAQYGFLGGAAGGIAGYRSNASAGEAIGILSGATLGAILGSHITEDTYIVIARVTLGVMNASDKHEKTVSFSSSPKLQDDSFKKSIKSFDHVMTTQMAVYAGGQNVKQHQIVDKVKDRLLSVITDII